MCPQRVRDLIEYLKELHNVTVSMCPQRVRDLIEYLKELR
jgi:hypothetical protein